MINNAKNLYLMYKHNNHIKKSLLIHIAIIPIMVLALVLSSLIAPVCASEVTGPNGSYNYIDMIKSYSFIDENTVSVSLEMPPPRLWYRINEGPLNFNYGEVLFSNVNSSETYLIAASLFHGSNKKSLWLGNIPDGTYMSVYLKMELQNDQTYVDVLSPNNDYIVAQYSDDNVTFSEETIQNEAREELAFHYQLHTQNKKYLILECGLETKLDTQGDVKFYVDDVSLTMQLSSLEWQAVQDQKTDAFQSDVKNSLAEIQSGQKQYNEEIMYGNNLNDHNVNGSGGFNDKVNQQGEQVQNGMNEINKVPKPDADTAIPDIQAQVPAEGMTLLSNIMGGITGFSIVPVYLMIVVGLFIVSFIMYGKKES